MQKRQSFWLARGWLPWITTGTQVESQETVVQVLRILPDSSPAPARKQKPTTLSTVPSPSQCTLCIAPSLHSFYCNQTLGSLTFGHDMLGNNSYIVNFLALYNAHQLQIDKWLLCANASRIPHDFMVNDVILAQDN